MSNLFEAARAALASTPVPDDGSPVRSDSITIGVNNGLMEVDGSGFVVNKDVNLALPQRVGDCVCINIDQLYHELLFEYKSFYKKFKVFGLREDSRIYSQTMEFFRIGKDAILNAPFTPKRPIFKTDVKIFQRNPDPDEEDEDCMLELYGGILEDVIRNKDATYDFIWSVESVMFSLRRLLGSEVEGNTYLAVVRTED